MSKEQQKDSIKPSATIVITRQAKHSIEVLLLRRNKALAFAPGLWVFPGGKIEEDEIAKTTSEIDAASLAALRETVEETDLEFEKKDLLFFQHWTTPESMPKRYGTYFFFAELKEMTKQIKIDDSEIKEFKWLTPNKAIEEFKSGNLPMLPPTLLSLQLLSKCKQINEAKELLSGRTPEYILPVLKFEDGTMYCMYEGDAGYVSKDIKVVGPRHRLVMNVETGDFNFEHQDCEVQAVNGGMHI